jgi:hypothetical protein
LAVRLVLIMVTAKDFAPGFQGSQRSSVEVTVYTRSGDPIILSGEGERAQTIPLDGRRPEDKNPSLLSVSTNKILGAPSGTWSVTMKPSRTTRRLFDQILDDDWVDIVFNQHARQWHVMRGLVDDMRRMKAVAGSGATMEVYTLTGRDFGKIFEVTPIWFSVLTDAAITGGVSLKVFGGAPNVFGTPDQAVEGFLLGFLRELSDVGRATWLMPGGMPGIGGDQRFVGNIDFRTEGFSGTPERIAISANYMMPQGTLWQLAQEWSDPEFCELFVDTVNPRAADPTLELPPDESSMVVWFRDRPFPTTELGGQSPYFNSIPTYRIPRQAIVNDDVGRSGMERFNAFFMSPQIAQELLQASGVDLYMPEWDEDDILRHGLRRFDVNTKYASRQANQLTLSRAQRTRVRDWHCMNPYLLNGTIALGTGMPWIRIGGRALIPGVESEDDNETYYVESVGHSWTFGSSTKTTLGVTRGWRGTDTSLIEALNTVSSNYKEPSRVQP